MNVSTTTNKDMLELTVLNESYFVKSATNKTIKSNFTTSEFIPAQSISEVVERAMSTMASMTVNSLFGVMGFNFGVQTLLSGSLSIMWNMLNTLQILMYMPLMQLSYPSQALTFCKKTMNFVSMKLVSSESFLDKLANTNT
mmetsp:Transcript_25586/g.19358  ORF Transcript_25586/g.19358 Transcript_25586/m.19358 type:complete len:141 (+) Transcript_25586:138-560(+)